MFDLLGWRIAGLGRVQIPMRMFCALHATLTGPCQPATPAATHLHSFLSVLLRSVQPMDDPAFAPGSGTPCQVAVRTHSHLPAVDGEVLSLTGDAFYKKQQDSRTRPSTTA